MATKRLVPNQQFQEAPTVAKHILISDPTKSYQHALVSSITDPIINVINAVSAESKTAVQDVLYSDHVLTQAEIDANSYTFRLTPRVPLTAPVEVTFADANGQSGIVVAHTIVGFGPTSAVGGNPTTNTPAYSVYGAFDVTVTGFADELSVGGSLGILTTWKKVVPTTTPVGPN